MVKYKQKQLDSLFHALADPIRRDIVERLSTKVLNASELAKPYDISLPAISKHIKVLERSDLVIRKRVGRVHFFSIQPQSLETVAAWMQRWSKFWNTRLDSLEDFLKNN